MKRPIQSFCLRSPGTLAFLQLSPGLSRSRDSLGAPAGLSLATRRGDGRDLMIGRVPHRLLLVGIVIATSACDNVSWGGMEIGLRSAAKDSSAATQDSAEVAEPDLPALELGPLLYAGIRQGDQGWIFPVAELTEGGLRPLPPGPEREGVNEGILALRLHPGQGIHLFHQGVRIGTLEVEEADLVSQPYCGVRVRASGHLQLIPEASEVQRFLALDSREAAGFGFQPFENLSSTYDQRVASLNLGSRAIPLVGATWPPALLDIRRDLQVFRLPGLDDPAILATFAYRDALQVGPAPGNAYSLMVLGEPQQRGFDLAYTWYRRVDRDGKGVPRYFSRLDWDRDGAQEILLEVLGEESRWFAAIDRGPDGWVLTYQDPCGVPEESGE